MTINEAKAILTDWVHSPSLLTHSKAVANSALHFAKVLNIPDREFDNYYITGLLHDADYEKYPEEHPLMIIDYLKKRDDVPSYIIDAIYAHRYNDKIDSLLDKVLFASDEISGFVYACILVRPNKLIDGLNVSSVKKKLKDKSFCSPVNREDIYKAAAYFDNMDFDTYIQHVIDAFILNREELNI